MNMPPTQTEPPRGGGGGGGCCAAGCFTILATGAILLALVLGGLWYVYVKATDALTADAPTTVQLEEPSEAQFVAADAKVQQLRTAVATKQAVTVEFTALDLNALIARDPEHAELRGKARVSISDSVATLDVSVPLRGIPLPRMNRRWFTGTVSFGFTYDESGFTFSPRKIVANGYTIAEDFFGDLAPSFNNYFNEEFEKREPTNDEHDAFWRQVKSASVNGDKLVITTKAATEGP